MGKLANIEKGKTSSDAMSGCAPIEWIKEVAKDFGSWVAKGAWSAREGIKNAVGSFFSGIGQAISGLGGFLGNIPGVKETAAFGGIVVAVGAKAISGLGGCGKYVIGGLKVLGGLAVAAGGLYLLSQGGFLAGIATVLTAGVLARFLIRRTGKLYRFNWNITQKQIEERAKARRLAIASQAGMAVGAGLAHFTCAKAGGLVVARFNPLSAALIKEVSNDTYEDMINNFKSLARTTASAIEEWLTLSIYVNVRSLVKKLLVGTLPRSGFLGRFREAAKHWGSDDAKPWSFASAIEEKIESIKFEELKNFVSEGREEFADVCTQAAYGLSYAL